MSNLSTAQVDTVEFEWIPMDTLFIPSSARWHTDALGNHYFNKNDVLYKIDSIGAEKFHQSIKSIGKDFEMMNINSMKILLFSKDQQNICFFDNTLTKAEDCIDLIDLEIENAQLITPSNRPHLIWIYDNVNSKLVLANTADSKVVFELTNLKGNFNFEELKNIQEHDSYLHLFTNDKIIVLDRFGSLSSAIEVDDYEKGLIHNNNILLLSEGNLKVYNFNFTNPTLITLPESDVIDFSMNDQFLFLRCSETVHKFQLEF